MLTRPEYEVRALLDRFERALGELDDPDDVDDDTRAAYDVLTWVLNPGLDDSRVLGYLPDVTT